MKNLDVKKMITRAIRRLEDKLVDLKYQFDPDQTLSERDAEIESTQRNLHAAHGVLVMLIEEELKEAV